LSLGLQPLATPLQKLGGQGADRSTADKAQRHLLADRLSHRSLLPEHPITSQRFGVRITLDPGLLHQAHRLILLPAWAWMRGSANRLHHTRVQKTNGPAALLAGPGDQAIAGVFFCR